MEKNIIVLGGGGQLAQCLKEVVYKNDKIFNFIFLARQDLDYTNFDQVKGIFEKYKPEYCVNCAAYTAVDLAEENQESAFEINTNAVEKLAENCRDFNVKLIHVSTDFVFNGFTNLPLTEDLPADPVNIYGLSKLNGELAIQKHLTQFYILRTSWLYSEKSNNFVKTMLRLAQSKTELNIVYDQIGTPTYAIDLAEVILMLIARNDVPYGIYHYSNEGVASWYDFAKAVFEFVESNIKLVPIASSEFVTKAKRPHYSVMDKTKIKLALNIEIPYWRDSLNKCIQNL